MCVPVPMLYACWTSRVGVAGGTISDMASLGFPDPRGRVRDVQLHKHNRESEKPKKKEQRSLSSRRDDATHNPKHPGVRGWAGVGNT